MSKQRLLVIPFLALIGLALILLGIRGGWYERYAIAPLQTNLSVTVDISRYNAKDNWSGVLHQPTTIISGTTSLPAHIRITRDGYALTEGNTNAANGFEFPDIRLHPGRNFFQIQAETKVAWRKLETTDYVALQYSPLKPSSPVLVPLPPLTEDRHLSIKGTADPLANIIVDVEQLPPGESSPSSPSSDHAADSASAPKANASARSKLAQPGASQSVTVASLKLTTSADDHGKFTATADLTDAGEYAITSHAEDKDKHPSDQSPAMRLTYDPTLYSRPVPKQRKTNINIGYRELRVVQEIVVPKDDQMVTDLVAGRTTDAQFIHAMFGFLIINEQFVMNQFLVDSTPLIRFQDNNAVITFDSGPNTSYGALPPFDGPLKISSTDPGTEGTDTITLTVKDYKLQFVNPTPTDIQNGSIAWSGEQAATALRSGINGKLTSDLSAHPLRVFQLTPPEVFPFYVGRALSVLKNLLPAIPIVWLLWLAHQEIEKRWQGESWTRRFERSLKKLLIWMLIPIGIDFLFLLPPWRSVEGSFYAVSHSLVQLGFYLLWAGGILAGVLLLFALLWFLRGRRWAFWLGQTVRGLAGAWFVTITISVTTIILARSRVGYYQIASVILLAPLLLIFLSRTWRWAQLAFGRAYEWAGARPGWLAITLLLLVSISLSYPTNNFYLEVYRVPTWSRTLSAVTEFFFQISRLVPYALVPILLFLLRQEDKRIAVLSAATTREEDHSLLVRLGAMLFAAYVIGLDSSFFWIPVPFLLGLLVFPRFVLLDPAKRKALLQALPEILKQRAQLINALGKRMNPRQLSNALTKLEKKFNAGDLSLKDFEDRQKQITDTLDKDDRKSQIANGLKARDVVLSIGPFNSNWENGIWAARKSIYLIVPLLLLYVSVFLLKEIHWYFPLMTLWAVVQVISFIVDALIGAFFFGFFFNILRGSSGLKKGMNVSLFVILCLLPSWIAPLSSSSLSNLLALLFRAGQTFLFYTIIGVWAFDYRNYRDALKREFQWKKFALFGDMPSATAFLSVTLTSIGVALTTVLTGQFTSVITQILKVALPIIPGPPIK